MTKLIHEWLAIPLRSVLFALEPCMPAPPPYSPPWQWTKENDGQFASINRPITGATHDKELPVGRHPLQLYSLGTPNGVRVTVMPEELLH
jgi:GSH-dependent disulfide-bond oxidoreductase